MAVGEFYFIGRERLGNNFLLKPVVSCWVLVLLSFHVLLSAVEHR